MRLIEGLSELIQHPTRKKIHPIYLGWVLYLFLISSACVFAVVAVIYEVLWIVQLQVILD